MLLTALATIAWAFGIVYATIPPLWLVVHGGIERWRKGSRMRVMALWPTLWLVVGAATWPWRDLTLYPPGWSWLAATPFFAIGLSIYYATRKNFSADQLIGRSELEPEHREQRLVATGWHARVRHPIYLGHLLMLLGWSLGSGLAVLYTLTAFAILTGAIMIRWEERELLRRFGDSYRQYQQRVPAIFPWWLARRDPALPAVGEYVFSLLSQLPPSVAQIEERDYPEIGTSYRLIPAVSNAASITLFEEGPGYHLELGQGTLYEGYDGLTLTDVDSIVRDVIEGRFEETIWRRKGKVLKTVGLLPTLGWHMTHHFGTFGFGSKQKEVVRYEPWTGRPDRT